MNNMTPSSTLLGQPFPAVGQITSPYEQMPIISPYEQTPIKDLNKYAMLKAVGKEESW